MQQDGKILLNPSWNVPCEVDLISIDYQIIRCVVEGWIEIQNCIVWNRTKWSWLKILKIQHRLFFQISFYFESIFSEILHLLPGLVPIWRFPIWKSENIPSLQWSEERILKKILQYLAVQLSEKAFYSNLKFISSIQNGCLHINSQSCQTHKFKTEISAKCTNCLVHVWVLVP